MSQARISGLFLLLLVVTIVGAAMRLPALSQRPMHGDEAVHGVKFGKLLENNYYKYDPVEYHGPTLNYLTLIPAWLSGQTKIKDVTETTLRIVPAVFGIALVFMPLMLIGGLGKRAAFFACVFTAVSPIFVFYSRYYIQEMMLVCFTFGAFICGYRYTQNKSVKWAMGTGLFLGLMHATKETCIIAFGCMFMAIILTLLLERGKANPLERVKAVVKPAHVVAGIIAAGLVSALFYSSFLSNPRGVVDSITTYTTYLDRAANNQLHIHPWYYYLEMLLYSRYDDGPAWSEAFIIILAMVGMIVAFTGRYARSMNLSLLRFLAFYTLLMTVIYSAIPYKTPWSMLGFYHGMILLACVGAAFLVEIATNRWRKIVVGAMLAMIFLALGGQAYFASFKFFADYRNPYVYAHTTNDIFYILDRVEKMSQAHPDGNNMHIEVICPPKAYWPLPWYLRGYNRVGFWGKVDFESSAAPVILAFPSVEGDLIKKLYETRPPGHQDLYVPLFEGNRRIELRHGVELRGYVVKDLLDKYRQGKAQDQ